MSYLKGSLSTRRTPQRERIPGRADQVPNSEGGFVWQLEPVQQLRRFLILGASGGTFYVSERKLVKENHAMLLEALDALGVQVVDEIVAISKSGRAPRNDEALWALAVCSAHDDPDIRDRALRSLPEVARTGTHLFQFVEFVREFRGWGPQLKRAVAAWYEREDVDQLAYQIVKYRQRGNWTHKGVLQMAHPIPQSAKHDKLFNWLAGPGAPARFTVGSLDDVPLPEHVTLFEAAQAVATPKDTAALIRKADGKLPREALRPEHLTDPDVWHAQLEVGMPMTALMRNLANMTRYGVLKPMDATTSQVCMQLTDSDRLRKARVHPLAVLFAMATYGSGHSFRGGNTWEPVPEIIEALGEAFYGAFGNVQAANQRFLLGLDVSGSMGQPIANSMLPCMAAAAAMAMVTHRTERASHVFAFDDGMRPVTITPRQRLDDVLRSLPSNYGGTDCSLPMLYALNRGLEVDTFCVYTDNETYAGRMHPAQALVQYREKTGIDAKLIVVGMASTGFSIADPTDPGMLDVVGMDPATPDIMTAFARGEV